MSKEREPGSSEVVGQWTLRIELCEELRALNTLNITDENSTTGGLTGYVCHAENLQDGSVNSSNSVNFSVVIGGATYTFTGTLNEETPPTMNGTVTGCGGGEDGTWSATAQTGVPDPPR